MIVNNYKNMADRIKSGLIKTKIYLQSLFTTNESLNKLLNHYRNDKETIK